MRLAEATGEASPSKQGEDDPDLNWHRTGATRGLGRIPRRARGAPVIEESGSDAVGRPVVEPEGAEGLEPCLEIHHPGG